MARYQIYDPKVCDYIVVDEEEFTRRETVRREESRQNFLDCAEKDLCRPNTVYLVHSYVGGFDETEEEYREGEQSYRERCLVPEGSVPKLSNKQRDCWRTFLEKHRTFYKGRIDLITTEDFHKFIKSQNPVDIDEINPLGVVRILRERTGDEIYRILEAVTDGR